MLRSAPQLIAIDVDGTITHSAGKVSHKVVRKLRQCVDSGVSVIFATGKNFASISHICRDVSPSEPAITCNGALVVDSATGRVVRSDLLDSDTTGQLLRDLTWDASLSLAVFTETEIICDAGSTAAQYLSAIGECPNRFQKDLSTLSATRIAKLLAAVEDARLTRQVYDAYRSKYSASFSVTLTSNAFVEFMAFGVSKGKALSQIAETRCVPRERIACIGDSDNDLSMFSVAGITIAMGNATMPVLEAADYVAPSVVDDGIVVAIDELLLKSHSEDGDGRPFSPRLIKRSKR